MKRRIKNTVSLKTVFCLLLLLATCALLFMEMKRRRALDTTPPTITCSQAVPEYTPGDDYSVLLADVRATDPEDGDVTASVRVRSISIAEDNSKAVVTYVAKDHANNIGVGKRIVTIRLPEPEEEIADEAETDATGAEETESSETAETEVSETADTEATP